MIRAPERVLLFLIRTRRLNGAGARINRCETTLYAVVNGKRVVVGHGVKTIKGSGTERSIKVTNRLTMFGRKLLNRPRGVKIRVRAKIRLAGSDETLIGTAKTQLLPSALVIAPGDGLFATGSAVISAKGVNFLKALRGKLDAVKRISCVGFTDSQGTPQDNHTLGQARADGVCVFLTRDHQLKHSATSRGESDPRATNTTMAGRAENRRVEIRLDY